MFYYKLRNSEIIKLDIAGGVYEPREDSMLLAAALEKILENKNIKSVLEIGCGSGLLSIVAAKRGCSVFAADVNPAAVECAERNAEANGAKIKTAQSDLFRNVPAKKFGLIVFNPPYLPEEQADESRTWAGGKNLEVVTRFIKEAKSFLEDSGEILLVISSLSNPEKVLKEFSDGGFEAEIIAERKIPWEKLFVVCAKHGKNI